jgi:hypothetical protein
MHYPYSQLSHIYKGNGEDYGNPTYKAPLNGTLRSFCSCRFVDPRSSYRKTVTMFSFRRVYSVALLSNKHEKSNSHSLRRCERQKTLQYIFEHWITHNRTQNWVLANKGNSLSMAILFIISINSSCVISYTAATSHVMWPKIVWNT